MSVEHDQLPGWTSSPFTAGELTRSTYRKGDGPAVIVIHEVPGITPQVLQFAEDVVARGFTVVMPLLVGEAGRPISAGYGLRSIVKICVAKEFTTWALNQTSPIIDWLRALARDSHERCGGPGVGALGMCFSGGFALGMMVDDSVVAPVLSQPSMPFSFYGAKRAADLNLSPDDLARVKQRVAGGCEVLGLRYLDDSFVGTRFTTLHDQLGAGFVPVELPSPFKRAHSVLTNERDEPSVERVLEFFQEKLLIA
jgi:dienelactone hydrolase